MAMIQTIYFATDHAGFALKQQLLPFVRDVLGYPVVDCGALVLEAGDDFTDYVAKAAREVSIHPKETRAIILGGSGQGEAMIANRFQGVRATVYYSVNEEIIRLSRTHNDANVLSLGARFLSFDEARKAVMLWLHTEHIPVPKYDRRIKETDTLSRDAVSVKRAESVPQKNSLAAIHADAPLSYSVLPSLPARSFEEIQNLVGTLSGVVSEIQVDIVDGVFAPQASWPFTEANPKEALLKLRALAEKVALEIDCMCMRPEDYLDVFSELPVARVIVHAESTTQYEKCISHARAHGYKIGLAVLNDTKPRLFDTYATNFDFVQVMGIKEVGAQGQPFDERTFETIRMLRAKYPSLEISVDGGVNEATIQKLRLAGANRFAPGSAIVRAQDSSAAYLKLATLAGVRPHAS
jgi:ribose 5-phosphate isomerase B